MTRFLQIIEDTNLTSINDASEVATPTERNVTEPHSQLRLNNALVAKVLEDIIVVHCNKYQHTDQAKELWSEVEQAIAQVRIHIVR